MLLAAPPLSRIGILLFFALILLLGANNSTIFDLLRTHNKAFATDFQTLQISPVGERPLGIAVNHETNRIYVTDYAGNGTVIVIDGSTNRIIDSIPVGIYPTSIDVDEKNNKIYVAHLVAVDRPGFSADPAVSVIDGNTNEVVATIPSSTDVKAVNPKTGKVYLGYGNSDENDVVVVGNRTSVMDSSTNNVTGEINLGDNFTAGPAAVNPLTGNIYILDSTSGTLAVVDGSTNKVIATRTGIGINSARIAVDSKTNMVYIANVDPQNLCDTVPCPPNSSEQAGGVAFGTGHVLAIDGLSLEIAANISVRGAPHDIVVDSEAGRIFVAGNYIISIIDTGTNSVVKELQVTTADGSEGMQIEELAWNPMTLKLYAVSPYHSTISVIEVTPPPNFTETGYFLSSDVFRLESAKIAAASTNENGSNVYVAWSDNTAGNYDIFFKASKDSGLTFGDTINLSSNPGQSTSVAIAAVKQHVYVIWKDDTQGNSQIFLRTSHDNGRTFGDIVPINQGEKGIQGVPRLAASGNDVYVLWSGVDLPPAVSNEGGFDIVKAWNIFWRDVLRFLNLYGSIGGDEALHSVFMRASNDNGNIFGKTVFLGSIARYDTPQIAASDDYLYVVWRDLVESSPPPPPSTEGGVWGPTEILLNAIPGDYINSISNSNRDQSQPTMLLSNDAVNVSQTAGDSNDPVVAASGNNVYVAWHDTSFYQTGKNEVVFKASTNNGRSFGDAASIINLSDSPEGSYYQQLVAMGSNVYVIWGDEGPANRGALFRASRDNGNTFDGVVNLGFNITGYGSPYVATATNGTEAFVLWNGATYGSPVLFFRASFDEGKSFDPPTNLIANYGNSREHQIAVFGDNLYSVWVDSTSPSLPPGKADSVFFRAITDNGTRTSDIINLSRNDNYSNGIAHTFPANPKIAVSEKGSIYVIWSEYFGESQYIVFAKSSDGGATFSDVVKFSSGNGTLDPSSYKILASGPKNIYVAWADSSQSNGQYNILFRASNDSGETFSEIKAIGNGFGEARFPDIAVSGKNIYVAWNEVQQGNPSNNHDIYLRVSRDNGATFGSSINISNNTGSSYLPRIAADQDKVYIAWTDNTPISQEEKEQGPFADSDVFFISSNDGGVNFGNITNLSDNDRASENPEIVTRENDVYVAWRDDTETPGSYYDVVYRKSEDGGVNFGILTNLSEDNGDTLSFQILLPVFNQQYVYVVWDSETAGKGYEVFLGYSRDGGSTFEKIDLSDNIGTSFSPLISGADNAVYVAWIDDTSFSPEIVVKRSPPPPPVRID